MKTLSPDVQFLLAIAREVVYSAKEEAILSLIKSGGIDWQVVKEALGYHGLAPFAYLGLKEYLPLLPQDVVKVLENTYCVTLRKIFILEQEFFILSAAFEAKGIVMIPFKGIAILEDLYSDRPVRPSADIDILVRKNDLDASVEVLERMGFKKELGGLKESYWRDQYHIEFFKKGDIPGCHVLVELHWDIDYPRKGVELLPEKFGRLRWIDAGGRQVQVLSVEDTFIALALHQRRLGQALNIRDVCDMTRLLNKYADTFDWGYILNETCRARLHAVIYFALWQVKTIFQVNAPQCVWDGLRVSIVRKSLIQRFIERNIFVKDPSAHLKAIYLKAHFLLYDNCWEPVSYIVSIPQEQFAKYYDLKPYMMKTRVAYHARFIYIPWKFMSGFLKKGSCDSKSSHFE